MCVIALYAWNNMYVWKWNIFALFYYTSLTEIFLNMGFCTSKHQNCRNTVNVGLSSGILKTDSLLKPLFI